MLSKVEENLPLTEAAMPPTYPVPRNIPLYNEILVNSTAPDPPLGPRWPKIIPDPKGILFQLTH